jgi:hypothetical protein
VPQSPRSFGARLKSWARRGLRLRWWQVLRARGSLREGRVLRVEIPGGPQEASRLLQHVLAAGVVVARFDARGPGLEERYRKVFAKGRV